MSYRQRLTDYLAKLLRRNDQLVVATLASAALVLLIGWWALGRLANPPKVEFESLPKRTARYSVNVNTAAWPELAQLPGVGETLARRIVERREKVGLFQKPEDLREVRGIGKRTYANLLPHLLPISPKPNFQP